MGKKLDEKEKWKVYYSFVVGRFTVSKIADTLQCDKETIRSAIKHCRKLVETFTTEEHLTDAIEGVRYTIAAYRNMLNNIDVNENPKAWYAVAKILQDYEKLEFELKSLFNTKQELPQEVKIIQESPAIEGVKMVGGLKSLPDGNQTG